MPWAHLHVAVVVPCVAAEPRVHQYSIEPVHDRVPILLRHVRADVQELGVAHILRTEQPAFVLEREGTHSPQAEVMVRKVPG